VGCAGAAKGSCVDGSGGAGCCEGYPGGHEVVWIEFNVWTLPRKHPGGIRWESGLAALPRELSSVLVVGHGRFRGIGEEAVSSQKEPKKCGSSE